MQLGLPIVITHWKAQRAFTASRALRLHKQRDRNRDRDRDLNASNVITTATSGSSDASVSVMEAWLTRVQGLDLLLNPPKWQLASER